MVRTVSAIQVTEGSGTRLPKRSMPSMYGMFPGLVSDFATKNPCTSAMTMVM